MKFSVQFGNLLEICKAKLAIVLTSDFLSQTFGRPDRPDFQALVESIRRRSRAADVERWPLALVI